MAANLVEYTEKNADSQNDLRYYLEESQVLHVYDKLKKDKLHEMESILQLDEDDLLTLCDEYGLSGINKIKFKTCVKKLKVSHNNYLNINIALPQNNVDINDEDQPENRQADDASGHDYLEEEPINIEQTTETNIYPIGGESSLTDQDKNELEKLAYVDLKVIDEINQTHGQKQQEKEGENNDNVNKVHNTENKLQQRFCPLKLCFDVNHVMNITIVILCVLVLALTISNLSKSAYLGNEVAAIGSVVFLIFSFILAILYYKFRDKILGIFHIVANILVLLMLLLCLSETLC